MNTDRLTRLRALGLAMSSLVLVAVVAWQGAVMLGHHREDNRRQDAVDIARAQVLDLTSLDSSTVKDRIAAMSTRVTGGFKDQFDGFAKTFAAVVAKDKIRVTGKIDSAGLSAYADDAATVLVASTADVTTGAKTRSTERSYRMSVALSRIGGTWLISGMEFVK